MEDEDSHDLLDSGRLCNLQDRSSLQSKIESLMSEREGANGSFNCNAESTLPAGNTDGATPESLGKERSKDVLSAGSFTEDTLREWLPKTQVVVADSAHENTTEVKICEESDQEKVGIRGLEIGCGNVKKRRGKRKRKGCNDVKEAASVGENEVFSANVVKAKEESSTGGCEQNLVPSCAGSARSIGEEEVGLAGILDSIMEPDYTSPFRCRLESQRRRRYKKLIRQHVDFGTIRSRIGDGTIPTVKELYRDLLLLCNNALVFFPTHSPEHKSALSLRRSVTERLRCSYPKHLVRPTSSVPVTGAGDMNLLFHQRNPVKPRSARPCNRKVAGKLVSGSVMSMGGKEPVGEVQLVECPVRKGVGRPAKGGSRGGRGRKRARRR